MEISMAETGPDFLLAELSSFRANVLHADVALVAGTKRFAAHRPVLAAASPFLAELMEQQSDFESVAITLDDTQADAMDAFLTIVYVGQVNVADHGLRQRVLCLLKQLRVTPDIVDTRDVVPNVHTVHVEPDLNLEEVAASLQKSNNDALASRQERSRSSNNDVLEAFSGHTLFSEQSMDKAALDARTRLMLEPSPESSKCRCLTCSTPSALTAVSGLSRNIHVCHYPDCRRQYKKSSHLRAHLRTHIGDQPFVCPWQGCGRRFTRSDELHRHYRIHTGEKNHKCSKCDKMFARSDHLKKHLRQHDNEQLKAARQEEMKRQHAQSRPQQEEEQQVLQGEYALKHLPRHLMGFFNNSNFQST